jgi:hypothetical protein
MEWIRHSKTGFLSKWQPADYFIYQLELVRYAVEILNNPVRHREMIKKTAKTRVLTWEEVARMWDRMFRKLL